MKSTLPNILNVLRNAQGAINAMSEQIAQMRGMFPDEDGTIEDAVGAGDEAQVELAAAVKALTIDRDTLPTYAQFAATLHRVQDRLDGKWYDPHGDLESDVRAAIRLTLDKRELKDSTDGMRFDFFEVRPCISEPEIAPNGIVSEQITSFIDEDEFEDALSKLAADDANYRAFWAVYGRYDDGNGDMLVMAIGDFMTKEDAHEVMNAILAPMAAARDLLVDYDGDTCGQEAHDILASIIDQSSKMERN
jgi:hypothetical protein